MDTKTNRRICEVVQLKLFRLRHFVVNGLWFTSGDVKVLLTQRSSLTKRSGNQVLLTKRWKGCAPLAYTTKRGAYHLGVYKMGVG